MLILFSLRNALFQDRKSGFSVHRKAGWPRLSEAAAKERPRSGHSMRLPPLSSTHQGFSRRLFRRRDCSLGWTPPRPKVVDYSRSNGKHLSPVESSQGRSSFYTNTQRIPSGPGCRRVPRPLPPGRRGRSPAASRSALASPHREGTPPSLRLRRHGRSARPRPARWEDGSR